MCIAYTPKAVARQRGCTEGLVQVGIFYTEAETTGTMKKKTREEEERRESVAEAP